MYSSVWFCALHLTKRFTAWDPNKHCEGMIKTLGVGPAYYTFLVIFLAVWLKKRPNCYFWNPSHYDSEIIIEIGERR